MSWLPKKSVVVPVDFSAESIAAVTTAVDMVASSADLHVVHVLPTLEPTEPGVIWSTIDNEGRKHHAELTLRERLTKQGQGDVHLAVRIGDPGREVADYASEIGAELIVLPSHGRSGLTRLLLGSVAERVVRMAHCPVLVLRK